jgi:hypothetical protein
LWFNLDCEFARQNYRKLKRKKKLYPWQITSKEVNNAEKHYLKTLDNNLKKTHRKEMSRGMKALRNNYPKEYWKIY